MTTVTKESLAARIAELEAGPRSIKEDFQLEAYYKLMAFFDECPHTSGRVYSTKCCVVCGEKLEDESQ